MNAITAKNNMDINPVDYYNRYHFAEAVQLLLDKYQTLKRDGDEIIETKNGSLVATIKVVGDQLITEDRSEILLPNCPYSAFMLYTKVKHRGNSLSAYSHLDREKLNNSIEFIRVGGDYFKEITTSDRFGIERKELIRWKKEEIKQDYGSQVFNFIRKYDNFILRPNNIDYVSDVKDSYNMYHPFPHKPSSEEGEWKWTERLLRHIFGNQYELGLRYLQVLYLHPTQALPILVLASKERETGKSTFIDYMSILFGQNMTVITPQDLDSSFNASYAHANIIGIEETVVGEKFHFTEKIKALSTNKFISINKKFIDTYKVPFYGKFIITTNDETRFMKIDSAEIRFWVRTLGRPEYKNTNIHEDLIKEIPAFLLFLSKMPAVDFSKSRMVFTTTEIRTSALERVMTASRPALYHNLVEEFSHFFLNNQTEEFVYGTARDIKREFFFYENNIDYKYINQIMTDEFGFEKVEESIYYEPFRYSLGDKSPLASTKTTGRPYIITKKTFINEKSEVIA